MEVFDQRQLPVLINEKQLSAIVGVSVYAARKWRCEDRGPRYQKLEGRLVRYLLSDVEKWLAAQPIGGGGVQQ